MHAQLFGAVVEKNRLPDLIHIIHGKKLASVDTEQRASDL
jgi:hypothetical protein